MVARANNPSAVITFRNFAEICLGLLLAALNYPSLRKEETSSAFTPRNFIVSLIIFSLCSKKLNLSILLSVPMLISGIPLNRNSQDKSELDLMTLQNLASSWRGEGLHGGRDFMISSDSLMSSRLFDSSPTSTVDFGRISALRHPIHRNCTFAVLARNLKIS